MLALFTIAALLSWYTLLWVVMALVSIGSILLVRSQWGRKRPMQRCVLLSLVAHMVLIAIAATVRFVSWPPGEGEEEPVRITIVAAAPQRAELTPPTEAIKSKPAEAEPETLPTETEQVAAPPVEDSSEPAPAEMPSPPTEPERAEPAAEPEQTKPEPQEPPIEQSLAPPDLMPEPAPEPTPEAAASEPQPAVPTPPEPATPAATEPVAIAEHEAQRESAPAPSPPPPASEQSPTPSDTITPLPAALSQRVQPDRLQSVIEQGGSRDTEQAVGRALEWLAGAQASDGRWDADRWQGGREFYVLKENRNGAGGQADTGVSALALLTFLGAGHTHLEGPYKETVAKGLVYLIRSQAGDGNLSGQAKFYARTYCHSMATFALAEAYALTGDDRLAPSVRNAINYLMRSENKSTGGWRYNPGNPGDVSQLGWIIMALRSAELAGVEIPHDTWDRIEFFLSRVARGRHAGLAAYQPRSAVSRPMTAEALYCRQVIGKPLAGLALNESVDALAAELPGDGLTNYYYWYYATLALHHAQHDSSAARHTWTQWNEKLKHSLVTSQVADGSNTGSWSPITVWGGYGGRVYTTSMAAMCLEVYYRFGTKQGDESPWVASRPRELK